MAVEHANVAMSPKAVYADEIALEINAWGDVKHHAFSWQRELEQKLREDFDFFVKIVIFVCLSTENRRR